jgi:hypothetical protein
LPELRSQNSVYRKKGIEQNPVYHEHYINFKAFMDKVATNEAQSTRDQDSFAFHCLEIPVFRTILAPVHHEANASFGPWVDMASTYSLDLEV